MNNDIKSLLQLHNNALNSQDLKGVMDTYESSPNVTLLGTGPGEGYVGEEAIGAAYNEFFNRFEPNTMQFKYDWITVGSKGNFGWFAVTVTVDAMVKNEKQERAFNMSGALEKSKGKLRMVSMHFSRLGAEQRKE